MFKIDISLDFIVTSFCNEPCNPKVVSKVRGSPCHWTFEIVYLFVVVDGDEGARGSRIF